MHTVSPFGICQGVSWQPLHQPSVAGSVQYSLSLDQRHSQKLHLLATVLYLFTRRTMLTIGSKHLISQTGWNRM